MEENSCGLYRPCQKPVLLSPGIALGQGQAELESWSPD